MRPIAFRVNLRIRKPISEVFDAVINPKKLSGYFTKTASAPLTEGGQAFWSFPEFPGEFPVTVRKIVPNQRIELEWEAHEGGYNTHVEMEFKEIDAETTLVTIKESGWRDSEKGVKSSYLNCSGWTQMLCCMKAYLEYDVVLRTGSYHTDDLKEE